MYKHEGEGRTKEIASWSRLPESTVRYLLQDLELLKIVKSEGHLWRLENSVELLIMELELYRSRPKQIKRIKKKGVRKIGKKKEV